MPRYGDIHRGDAHIEGARRERITLPALRCSEMQVRNIAPALKREA